MSKNIHRSAAALTLATAALMGAVPDARGAAYTIRDLGAIAPGNQIFGNDLDAAGDVLVGYLTANGYRASGLLANGVLTPSPGLGGRSAFDNAFSPNGTYVGGYGRIAGTDPLAANPIHAYLSNTRTHTTTGMPTLGGTNAYGNSANDIGVLVGNADLVGDPVDDYGDPVDHAVVWANGKATDLGTLDPANAQLSSQANSINRNGLIVGYSEVGENGSGPAFTTQATTWTPNAIGGGYTIHDLGALDGPNGFSLAARVNADGVIAGTSDTADGSTSHAALFADGLITDLGGPDGGFSQAFGVNHQRQAVGILYTADDLANGQATSEAGLFEDGSYYDLSTLVDVPGWQLQYADDINDAGQIVGVGFNPDGISTGFILTPTGQAVPEPASLSLAAAGAVGLLGRRRRRSVGR